MKEYQGSRAPVADYFQGRAIGRQVCMKVYMKEYQGSKAPVANSFYNFRSCFFWYVRGRGSGVRFV